jgi:Tfp pilus assembly PilM family ATPase
MASRVLGVDLGAYSVKVVVSNPGFRQAQVTEVIERLVPEGEEPHLIRAAAVVGEILSRYRGEDDSIYSAVSGDSVFLHVLEFGFKSLRRADLERAVGAELEGVLPIDLEDMVYAFEQIPKLPEPELPPEAEGDPNFASPAISQHGMVAAPPVGMRLLTAATQRQRAEEFLLALRENGVDPRGLLAAPAPYARFAEKLTSGEPHRVVGVVDIGHMRTDICLAKDGKPIYARSVARGGHHLTRVMARTWNLDYRRASEAKHNDGFVASRALPATSEAGVRMSDLLGKELSSLVRELRRSLSACRAKTGFSPEQLVLVGGGSRLRGLAPYLAEHLGLRVDMLSQEDSMRMLGEAASMGSLDTCALALGVAIDGASAKPTFDLRQGSLAFKADLSFLRTKVRTLAVAVVAMMAFGVISAKTGISKLRSAEETLDRRIALESAEALGEQLSASDVLDRVGPVEKGAKVSPVPDMTAYDMLLAFNEALPKKDKAVLDVGEIDIQPGKVVVKASSSPFETTSALQGIKNLEESLKASKCFNDFSSPESQPAKNDSRQFTLTIKSDCND